MSDKFTEIRTPSGGLGEWGHLTYLEGLIQIRSYYRHQAEQAAAVLAEIESGNVRVFHQLGPHAARNRKEIFAARLARGGSDVG